MEIYIGITENTVKEIIDLFDNIQKKEFKFKGNFPKKEFKLKGNFCDFKNKYIELIEKIEFNIKGENVKEKLKSIKRDFLKFGPYPNVSLYENSNKILTDLLTLETISYLIEKKEFEKIKFEKIEFNLGNSNTYPFDLITYDQENNIEYYEISYTTDKGLTNKKNSIINKIKKLNEKEEFKNNKIEKCCLFYDFPDSLEFCKDIKIPKS